jgi:subtilisin family serine protease
MKKYYLIISIFLAVNILNAQPIKNFSTILSKEYKDKAGNTLTGKGIVIGDIDSGIDIFHPMFFFADGGEYNWIDVNNNGIFDAGKDAVDLNRNGKAEDNEKLNYIEIKDLTKMLDNDSLTYQPDLDFLYADINGNGKREYGEKDGFTETSPTYGEQFFISVDKNKDNKLNIGEKLIALKTSKVKAIREKSGTIRRRGVDLIKAEPDDGGHGTGVCGLMLGGHYEVQKIHGIAPDAEVILANIKYNYTPRFVRSFTDYIKFLRDENVNTILFEDGEWMWEFMDGSTEEEQLIDELTRQGIPIIAAAGNLATGNMHIKDTIKAGVNNEYMFTCNNNKNEPDIDGAFLSFIWSKPDVEPEFILTTPSGNKTASFKNGTEFFVFDGYEIYFAKETSPRGNVMMKIYLSKGINSNAGGRWSVEVKSPDDIIIDGYLADVSQAWGRVSHWTSEKLTDYSTITFPCTSDSVISVAAYVVIKSRKDEENGMLAKYSGRGPLLNGKIGIDITAPAHTTFTTSPKFRYMTFGGTSASAPHVVGTVALLLQYNTALTHSQIRNILRKTAITDSYTGSVPNVLWGYGKLNIEGAIEEVIKNY